MAKSSKRSGKGGKKSLSAKDAGALRGGATRSLSARKADGVRGGVAKRAGGMK